LENISKYLDNIGVKVENWRWRSCVFWF
jgi:hypothetical protein